MSVSRAARIIIPSRYLAEIAAAYWGLKEGRVSVVPNPAHPVDLSLTRDELRDRLGLTSPTLVFAGRLVPAKNVALAISALRSVPTATLVVIGDGPQRGELTNLVGEEGLGDRVRMVGALPRSETIDWLRAADAACLPVLGICFGAQALAAALGGRVHRLPERELGWVSVESADPERIASGPWLTWHEDGIELPPLAYELARNRFGVQAFCHCRHLAVQFHPEATPAIVADWARGDAPPELDREALLRSTGQLTRAATAGAFRLFDGFAARAGLAALASRA
jgi:anthranilate/para-aminobenzoate synthase component II